MIVKIAHVCLYSSDLKKSEDFYCGVLGLEKCFDFVREGKVFGLYLKAGGDTFIEIFESQGKTGEGAIAHICLETDDIDSLYNLLKESGREVTEKKLGSDKTWQIWTADPDGVKIEFHQYTPESMQFKGGRVNVDF
jgi:lactoylglutathione lyase/glyoxylase I family protein